MIIMNELVTYKEFFNEIIETAKRAIEIAIEENEENAIKFIDSKSE